VKVIYIAGPFRSASTYVPGHQDAWGIQQNIMHAMKLALEVWRLGAVALCPHANAMFFQNAAPDTVWLDGDIELLRRSDAMLLTPNWDESSGARAERTVAIELCKPVFTTLLELKAWLAGQPFVDGLPCKTCGVGPGEPCDGHD
jgi:hypothetical protein